MICYVLAMGKQHLGPHVVVGYGIKIFWPGLFITSPDHLVSLKFSTSSFVIRVNLLHSLTILVLLWFTTISLVFFYLGKVLFQSFLQFKGLISTWPE